MVTIKATSDYADIITDNMVGRFRGELCDGNLFYANIESFEWIRNDDDIDKFSKICLVCEALAHNYDGEYSIFFSFDDARALCEVMDNLPDLKGALRLESDNAFKWMLPNGIVLKVTFRKDAYEKWFVQEYYQIEGQEKRLNHWNPEEYEIFEDLTDINFGRKFWVTKTSLFGNTTLPVMTDKGAYDKLSDKQKRKYTII